MARTGAVVALLALALLLVASTSTATPKCCTDNHSWGGGDTNQQVGCSPAENGTCNDWCSAACRGGECKLRGGKHVCHCYC